MVRRGLKRQAVPVGQNQATGVRCCCGDETALHCYCVRNANPQLYKDKDLHNAQKWVFMALKQLHD